MWIQRDRKNPRPSLWLPHLVLYLIPSSEELWLMWKEPWMAGNRKLKRMS